MSKVESGLGFICHPKQMGYGKPWPIVSNGLGERIWTSDPLLPKHEYGLLTLILIRLVETPVANYVTECQEVPIRSSQIW